MKKWSNTEAELKKKKKALLKEKACIKENVRALLKVCVWRI